VKTAFHLQGDRTLKITDTSAQDVELPPGDHRNRNIIGGSGLLLIVVATWFLAPAVERWATATVTVPLDRLRLAEVTRGDLVRDVSVQGRVVAAVSPTLYATAAGSITLQVDAGASVDEGQILAVVDSPELNNRFRQAESALEQLVIELARQRIESRQQALEKRKAADLADVALVAADLQRQVDDLSIRSPVGGVVGDLLVEQKAAVARDTPVLAVVDLSRFEIDAQVPESYADDLGLGMAAEILVGNERYAGQLVAVSPEIVSGQVGSRIRFTGRMPENIRQNQRLTTRILIEERPDVLMVQRGQFLESGGGRIAYVMDGNGLASKNH